MQQRSYMGIDGDLLQAVRKVAVEQGRVERDVIEDAVRRYLDSPSVEYFRREREQRKENGFLSLLDRMGSRFDLDEDEAMDLANAEIRAMREERRVDRGHEEGQR